MLVRNGQVTALPSPATRPTVTCGSARNVSSAMKTTSQSVANVQPSPTAGPFTAATIGTRTPSMASTSRLAWRIALPRACWSSAKRGKSAVLPPALNARPPPVSTTARASGSSSMRARSAGNSACNSSSKEFIASGRLSVTRTTGPDCSASSAGVWEMTVIGSGC
jgi:hypothetical protein